VEGNLESEWETRDADVDNVGGTGVDGPAVDEDRRGALGSAVAVTRVVPETARAGEDEERRGFLAESAAILLLLLEGKS
jgi:hypothetical protein